MNKPLPEECRPDGYFHNGSERFAWAIDTPEGHTGEHALYHTHPEGECPLGPGGMDEGRAEEIAREIAAQLSISSVPLPEYMVEREPDPERRIVKVLSGGRVVEMDIQSFVVFKTVQALLEEADHDLMPDAEQVLEASGHVARMLVDEGWFSEEEYLGSLVNEDLKHLDEELEQFQHTNP